MEQFVYMNVDLVVFFLSPVLLNIQTCSAPCHNDSAFEVLLSE